jgi:hypothetical protein
MPEIGLLQIILAQRARQGPRCDTPALPSLVDAASRILPLPIGVVLADAEFDSEANHGHIRTILGAHSVIPTNPRRGIPEGAIRYQMHRAFPRKLWAARQDRNGLLGDQTETLGESAGPQSAFAGPAGAAAGFDL